MSRTEAGGSDPVSVAALAVGVAAVAYVVHRFGFQR